MRNAAVNRANQRLAFFTDILGEAKMRKYTQGIQGLDYREGLFLRTRPGLVAAARAATAASAPRRSAMMMLTTVLSRSARALGARAARLAIGCGGSSGRRPRRRPAPTAARLPPRPGRRRRARPPQRMPPPGSRRRWAPLKMNAAAQSAYQQGLAAYASGDLPGAKAAFQEAVTSRSERYQAHYSLGVVLERLGDPDALAELPAGVHAFSPTTSGRSPPTRSTSPSRGNLTEAESFLQQKRGQMPNSAGVIAALAEVKSIQRDTGSAQRSRKRRSRKTPTTGRRW